MKKYPLHLTNRFNDLDSIKQRVKMVYRAKSRKVQLLRYTTVLLVILLGGGVIAFQQEDFLDNFFNIMREYNSKELSTHFKGYDTDALIQKFDRSKKELEITLEKGQKIAFVTTKKENQKKFASFTLVNNQGHIIATNQKEQKVYAGFKAVVPRTDTYYLKAHHFSGQSSALGLLLNSIAKP